MAANHGNSPSIQVAMEEIRSLQKKVTTMEKERVEQNVDSNDESLIESQPLRQSLWDSKVPDNFKSPHLPTFDGTLKYAALRWYMNLPNNSIESYADFHKKFIHQFSGTKHVKVTATSLFTIRQNYAETLREYLARFSEATITVSNPNHEMFVAAFHNGLKVGHFNESLAQKSATLMQEVIKRASCYIKGEESNAEKRSRDAKEKDSRSSNSKGQNSQPQRNWQNHDTHKQGYRAKPYHPPNSAGGTGYPHYRRYPADREYTPLNRARVHVLHEILQAGLTPLRPPRMHNTIMGPDTEAWCAYHRCKGHDTERCFRLRDLIEDLIRSGHLRKFLGDAAKGQIALPKQTPNQQKGAMEETKDLTLPRTPEISFNPEDARDILPHDDDPLVIQVQILNCDVKRVLIDSGRFAGEQVDVMGHITLYTTSGEDENAKTIKVRYLVVKTLFTSYNIITGRPTFNTLGAVMSTLYLSIKYPLYNGKVGVVKGDQVLAKKCYESSLKIRHRPSKPVSPLVSGERTNGINMVNITDLDPREEFQERRVSPIEDLRRVSPIEDLEKVQIGEHSHQTTNIGTSLQPEERERIVTLLRNNRDLFAWQPSDMPGIDESVITHKLSISSVNKPVVQRKRKVGEERRAAITEEVGKLKEAGFIEEIKYPTWLANVVMVKKASDKWRMCVDFTDLNKACPKDPYPLPNIDRLIDGASGYKTLSFMDAYFGYNQIKMHPMDAQHTTFMSNTCNYFYNVMPFGLKNAGATYQWLMDRVFVEQIGKNLEGKTLYLYLAVSEKPVYFVSRTLRGAETRYQKIERLSLAVVITTHKLRQYFQSHQVVLKTDYPIKNVLSKPDLVGRMVAWSVELSEFDITYIPRGPIKSQALADFVLKMTDPPSEGEARPWTLSVDGSSNLRGSGAGVAEYEALIAGMKLAKEMEVQELKVQSDSQLVANQVSGEFQTKDPQLAKN
ncbi:hypothetical protein TSUD_372110 [Trifolium subterraneum]|uniref:Uncharacterized protein n=1 Tax=Trifolium subterraneum TaxID=3900 RepID=A0A2Z6MWX7_TRISU|nr:hypothetical protein TSUD_372110 [Trifolium subterraneum]